MRVMKGVVSGVRDYGNRMGIPTANGAICFDEGFVCNPLVYCGNVGIIPRDKCEKTVEKGDLIVLNQLAYSKKGFAIDLVYNVVTNKTVIVIKDGKKIRTEAGENLETSLISRFLICLAKIRFWIWLRILLYLKKKKRGK